MNIVSTLLNVLLGLVFVVFGLNGFLNFIPMPATMGPDMDAFGGVMASTGFLKVIKALEIVCGLMIIGNFKRPLAYIILFPIVVGICLVELLIMKQPGIGLLLVAILGFLIYQNRDKYMPMVA
jgi:putative oxidoreductase